MKKILFIILSFLFNVKGLQSQSVWLNRSVTSSGGGTAVYENIRFYHTIGECLTSRYVLGSSSLTDGFQQPLPGLEVLSKENKVVEISIYPNPSNGIFQLNLETNNVKEQFTFYITDIKGKNVLFQSKLLILKAPNFLNIQNLPPGQYFIHFFEGPEYFSSKKIQIIK